MEDENSRGDDSVTSYLAKAVGSAEEVMGKQVRRFREIRGWSQQELARRMHALGHSWRQTTVAKTEAADRPIRVNEAQALAMIFDVSIEDLLVIPIDDFALAQATAKLGQLRARRAAAWERLKQAEQAKEMATAGLEAAQRELEEISEQLRTARSEVEVMKFNRKVDDGE